MILTKSLDQRGTQFSCTLKTIPKIFPFERYSSFNHVQQCLAYCIFLKNCKKRKHLPEDKPLKTYELKLSLKILTKLSQAESFFTPKHIMTNLIESEHKRLHAGPQLVPPRRAIICKKVYRNCSKCSRHTFKNYQPAMGHLPTARACTTIPFANVGVDYAGPLLIKNKTSLYVCLATKSLHLKVDSDLSTSAFLMFLQQLCPSVGNKHIILIMTL